MTNPKDPMRDTPRDPKSPQVKDNRQDPDHARQQQQQTPGGKSQQQGDAQQKPQQR